MQFNSEILIEIHCQKYHQWMIRRENTGLKSLMLIGIALHTSKNALKPLGGDRYISIHLPPTTQTPNEFLNFACLNTVEFTIRICQLQWL